MNKKTVCVVGLGYIGLPTAAFLASNGYKVLGVDVKQSVVDTVNGGKIHFVESGLGPIVASVVGSKSLTASLVPSEADVFVIAVPTPFHGNKLNKITGSPVPNVDYIIKATQSIAAYVSKGNLVLLESTSPVGTTNKVGEVLNNNGVNIEDIYIAHSPERVLPGQIMRELTDNDRVVGGINQKSTQEAAKFYRSFVKGEVLETDARTAEMSKLTENSFRDVNIAFANEISVLCDEINIDVRELIELSNRHPRVNILYPGCGVGGHCISVDPWFIVDSANGKAKLIEQARKTNDLKADWVIEKVNKTAQEFENKHKRSPIIACMGLAFKPNIDDLRESPALYIATELDKELSVVCVEPNISEIQDLKLVQCAEGIQLADIVIFLVAHKEFSKMEILDKTVIDTCGVLE